MQSNAKKVGVLMGGIGRERDVSLESGRCVAQALEQAGYEVVTFDVAPDRLEILHDSSIDVFFLALHGEFGEDGQLQTILEQHNLTYTGSLSGPCQVAFDKQASKDVFKAQQVLTPEGFVFDPALAPDEFSTQIKPLGTKVVVKPICQGSSVGVQIVDVNEDLFQVCVETVNAYGTCLVEAFVEGREMTVGILNGQALPVIEIRTPGHVFYDYQAKYVEESTQYLFDTVTSDQAKAMQASALSCFEGIGLRHMARVDFMLTEAGQAYALEVNTIPGLTSHSLLPKAAAKVGLDMSALCGQIIEAACAE